MVSGFGDTEVDDFGDELAVLDADEDVGRFDVAMDDAFLVGMLESVADGNEETEVLASGEAVWSQKSPIATPSTHSMTK